MEKRQTEESFLLLCNKQLVVRHFIIPVHKSYICKFFPEKTAVKYNEIFG